VGNSGRGRRELQRALRHPNPAWLCEARGAWLGSGRATPVPVCKAESGWQSLAAIFHKKTGQTV